MSKKHKWSNAAISFLVLTLCLGLALSACSKSNSGRARISPSVAVDPYDKLPKEVSVSMFDRGQVSSEEGTYEQNRWTKWIADQSGIKLKIVTVPRNQAGVKMNTLLATGEAPDLIWEFDRNYIGNLVTQGVLQPLDDYIDKYSTVVKQYIQDNPDLTPYMTFNGKIYGLTTKRTPDQIANGGLWIRQDWLDKVGMKAPETEDEFFTVLQAFKDKGLTGRANAPVISLHPQYLNVFNALYSTHTTQWYIENGNMVNANFVERVADEIAFERKLYANGYIDQEYLTDTNMQRSMADWTAGKTGVLIGSSGSAIEQNMKDLMKNIPEASPVPLEPFATKYGKAGMYQETPALIYVAFNNKMKNPKAAMQYLDWMLEKGWFTLLNGLENQHYKLVNGVPQIINDDLFRKEVAYAGEYAILRNHAATFKPEDRFVSAAQDPISQRWAKLSSDSLQVALKNKFRRDIPYSPNIAEINSVFEAIRPKLFEIRTRAIIKGDITPDQALEQIRMEWSNAGGGQANKLAQEWYENNKQSFK